VSAKPSGASLPARATADGIVLAVRLTPKSAADAVTGIDDTGDGPPVLKARVRAAPEKGKANAALAELVADWLDEPKSRAELVSGGKSRLKQVLVRGDAAALMQRLAARLAALKPGD
jgi:uncharacterized protein YggU (UPF0235/DUF167 family)